MKSDPIYDVIFDYPAVNAFNTIKGKYWTFLQTEYGPGIAMTTEGFEAETLRLAAANSFWNRGIDSYVPFKDYYTDGIVFSGKTVGVVGHLGGIIKRYGNEARKLYCFDLNPKDGDLSADKEDEYLPQCDIAVITGSSIQNHTLPHLLELCESAYVVLVGPSAPKCSALFDFGIDRIAGICLSDTAGIMDHVKTNNTGTPYRYGNPFVICREQQ